MSPRKQIMIVDDELDYMHVIKLMLEGTGNYHVRTLSFAPQAAHVAREFLPRAHVSNSFVVAGYYHLCALGNRGARFASKPSIS